jgi:hypothetical protein
MAEAEGGGGFPSLAGQPPGGDLTPPPRRPTAGWHLAYARQRLRPPLPHVPRPSVGQAECFRRIYRICRIYNWQDFRRITDHFRGIYGIYLQ